MSMKLFEMKQERTAALKSADVLLRNAEFAKRELTAQERVLFDTHIADAESLAARIEPLDSRSTLRAQVNANGLEMLSGALQENADITGANGLRVSPQAAQLQATQFRRNFSSWMSNALTTLGGGIQPSMEATFPSGPVSVGTGGGVQSVAITIPTDILPYLPSYFALDSFGLAGATTIFTDHTRPLIKPILSAGAPDSVIAENAATNTSQPFGVSGFTFGGTKYERLVLASYEGLMNSELPLQAAIMDELLATIANTLTVAATTSFVAALTGASSTLSVGVGGSGGSVYTSIIDLRHAVPPRFDTPDNVFMLSRATLAQIRNTQATTSGVPMFSPDGTKLLDRNYVINDALDSTTGAGVGFVAFGSFADGVYLRRTPVMTRVFQELYAGSGQIGFRTTQWADQHFLAELAGAAQPPTYQPIFYTNVVSES